MAEPKTTDPNNDNMSKLVVFEDNNNNNNNPDMVATKKTKKKKSVNIFKVALMLLLRRPAKPNNVAVDVASKGMWKSLVASMRPLHLQGNESTEQEAVDSPSLHPAEEHVDVVVDPGLRASPSVENFEDVSSFPLSPNYIPKSASVSSLDEMSRYASAVNLQELDQNDKDENENGNKNENENNNITEANMDGGDEMIDAKAEMFIAQFYEQMKLQRSDSYVHYMEMITRSIG